MPKYIKHYIQNQKIRKFRELKSRKKKLFNLLHVKVRTQNKNTSKYKQVKTRCIINGRSRAYYSQFKLSRHSLRQIFVDGQLPGVTMSSW